MAPGLGSGAVVGAGWTSQVGRMGWTPTATVAPPHDAVVEVWWMSQVVRGRYNAAAQQWIGLDGYVMSGVTHWRRIEQ